MIRYDKETKTINNEEYISWQNTVLPIYEEEYEIWKDDAETCDPPEPCYVPAPDKLTDDEINELMEFILDRYESESEYGARCGYGVSLDEDFIQTCVADWCSDYDEDHRP